MQTRRVTTKASNRDLEFTATCVGSNEIPITLHLGQDLAVTTWLFRKPKYWLAQEPTRVSFAEVETLLAQRPNSHDARKASTATLQDAVIELGWTLNDSSDEIVKAAGAQLAAGEVLDAAAITEITAKVEAASWK